jgi:hypothetical protein
MHDPGRKRRCPRAARTSWSESPEGGAGATGGAQSSPCAGEAACVKMPTMNGPKRRVFLLGCTLALAAAGIGGCAGGAAAWRESHAEAAILKREVEALQELVHAAEGDTLISPRGLAVGIREDIVKNLLSASLPQEFVIADQLRVQITSADVSFQSSQGLVTLRGRVTRFDKADDFADVVCSGGIGTPQVSSMGRLTVRIALDRFEIPRVAAGGRESRVLRSAVDTLSQQSLGAIRDGLAPLEIPVRLQQQVPVAGIAEGPVQIAPGQIPLKVTVTRVMAISGRLWILIDVAVGRWQADPPGRATR